jgi:restriction system protein
MQSQTAQVPATHGLEALQALVTQQEAQGADKAMYVCLGGLTEQAGKFARENGVEVVGAV